jgi:hypothetical protein
MFEEVAPRLPVGPGEEVLVEFEEEEGKDGKRYRRVRELRPVAGQAEAEAGTGTVSEPFKDRLIYRSVCIKAAASAPFVKSGEEIIALARELERFLYEASRESEGESEPTRGAARQEVQTGTEEREDQPMPF